MESEEEAEESEEEEMMIDETGGVFDEGAQGSRVISPPRASSELPAGHISEASQSPVNFLGSPLSSCSLISPEADSPPRAAAVAPKKRLASDAAAAAPTDAILQERPAPCPANLPGAHAVPSPHASRSTAPGAGERLLAENAATVSRGRTRRPGLGIC